MPPNPLKRTGYDLFSISFSPTSEAKKLKKEIVVIRYEGVKDSLSDADVEKIVQTYCTSTKEFNDLKEISITDWDVSNQTGTVLIGGKTIQIENKQPDERRHIVSVKHLPAISKEEAKYGTFFWSNIGTLIHTAWEKNKLFGLLSVLFFPITFILGGIETRKYDLKAQKVAKSFDVLFESKLPSSQAVNLEVLKTLQIFLRKSGIQNEPLNETLANAILNGQNLDRASRGEPIDFTGGVLQQLNDSSKDKPVTIPCGQYQGELFHASYLQIWKEADDIIVKRFAFTTDAETLIGKTDPIQEYQFPKNEEGFTQFCQMLVHHLKPTPMSYALSKAQRKQAPMLGIQVMETPEVLPAPLSHQDAIRDSLLNFGAIEKPLDPKSLAVNQKFASAPTTDPWKLAAVLLGSQETDLGIEDKNQFLFLTTRYMVRSLCKYAAGMDEIRRDLYFARIEDRLQKLEKRLGKQFGPQAKELLIPVHDDVRKARTRYARGYARQQELTQATALHTPPASKPIQLSFSSVSSSESIAETPAVQGGKGIASHQEALQRISSVFLGKGDKTQLSEMMRSITAGASALIDQNKYEQAAKLTNAMLDKLPPLTDPSVWEQFDDRELKEISVQLTLASQYLFEAKLRLNHPLCNNVELVNLFHSQATLIYLARRRTNLAKQDLIEKIIARNDRYDEIKVHAQGKVTVVPDGQPDADDPFWIEFLVKADPHFIGYLAKDSGLTREQAISLSFDQFTGDLNYLYHSLALDPYLQLGSDSRTLEKVEGIRYLWFNESRYGIRFRQDPSGIISRESICLDSCYVEAIPTDTRFANWHYTYNLHQIIKGYDAEGAYNPSESKPLSAAHNERNKKLEEIFPAKDPDETRFLMGCLGQIISPKKDEERLLPDFVMDMRRSELFLRSAQHPEHSLFISFNNKIAAASAASKLFQSAEQGVEDPSDTEAVVKNLQRMHRSLLRQRVDQMPSRISLSVENTYLPSNSSTLYPTLRLNTDDSGGLEYFPFGLPGDLNQYTPPPSLSIHSMLCGSLPSWIASSRGVRYSPTFEAGVLERNQSPVHHIPYALSNDGLTVSHLPTVRANRIPSLTEQEELQLLTLTAPEARPKTVQNILVYITSKPHLLEIPLVRMQLWNAFSKYTIAMNFTLSGIDGAFCVEPEQIQKFLRLLKKLPDVRQEALTKQHTQTVAFIDELMTKMGERAAFFQGKWDIVKESSPENIRTFKQAMEPYVHPINNKIRFLDDDHSIQRYAEAMQENLQAIAKLCSETVKVKDWEEQLSNPGQITAGLHFLSLLPLSQIEFATAQELASYLQIWSSVQRTSSNSELPQLFYHIQTKMENLILPAIDQKLQSDKGLCNAVCSLLIGKTSTTPFEWKRDAENDYIYTSGAERLNIATPSPHILLEEVKHGEQQIPDEVLLDPLYVRIFGNKSFNTSYRNLGLEELYQWSIGDRTFEIRRNIEDRSITRISQTFNGSEYVFSSAIVRDDIPLSRLMKQQGIWIKVDGEGPSGLLFIAPQDRWTAGKTMLTDSQVLHLDLSSSQQLTGIWMPSAKGRQKVAMDNTFQANKIFQCCDPSNILMLLNSRGNQVEEIVFLKENLHFKHQDNRWKVIGDEGLFLQTHGTYRLRELFGDDYENFMLSLVKVKRRRDGKEKFDGRQLRIWPHHILPALGSSKTGRPLEFVQATDAPQMIVTQDVNGNWHGSPSSFLYLAIVSYARGNIEQALFFLNQVNGKRSLIKKGEADLFDQIASNLQSLPATTSASIAFQLKASLLISRVQREAYGRSNFNRMNWEQYHQATTRLLNLHEAYQKACADPDKLQSLQKKNLLLSDPELGELQTRLMQSLQKILDLSTSVSKIPPKRYGILALNGQTNLKQFTPYLILMMQPPVQGITLSNLSCQATPEQMLGRFWDYWQAIFSATKVEDLRSLTPLYLALPPELDTQPELKKAVETARSLLLTLAELKKKQLENPKLEVQLPPLPSQETFQRKGDLLAEMHTPSEWFIGRLLQAYYRNKHEVSRNALESQVGTIFAELLDKSAGIDAMLSPAYAAPLLSNKDQEEWGSIDSLLEKLTQDPSLPKEEKALYKQIQEQLATASDFKENKDFMSLLRRLNEAKAPVMAMRYQAELQGRIDQLEKTAVTTPPFQAQEVPLVNLIQTTTPNWHQSFFAAAYQTPSIDSFVAEMSKHPSRLAQFVAEYSDISQGKKSVANPKTSAEWFLYFATEIKNNGGLPPQINPQNLQQSFKSLVQSYDKLQKALQIAQLKEQTELLLEHFPEVVEGNPQAAHENQRMRAGIEAVAASRQAQIQSSRGQVPQAQLKPLRDRLVQHMNDLTLKTKHLKEQALHEAKDVAEELGLAHEFNHPEIFGKEEISHILLDKYEMGELNLTDKQRQGRLEQALTEFAFLATQKELYHQIVFNETQSLPELAQLSQRMHAVQKQLASAKMPEQRAALKNELLQLETQSRIVSGDLLSKIERADNLTIYSTNKEPTAAKLDNQEVSRAYLVHGYLYQIGITSEQIETIEAIIANPSSLQELRMGLGKSSVIFPLVARLLARQGFLPIVLFTDELIEQGKKEMDRRAYEFKFQRNPDLTSEVLSQEYQRLLEVKTSHRYMVSTASRLAAVENKINEYASQLSLMKEQYDKVKEQFDLLPTSDDSDRKKQLIGSMDTLYRQMVEKSSQLFWLRKINAIFDPDEHNTRFLVDEADEVFNFSLEFNYAEGDGEPIDPKVYQGAEDIFSILLSNPDPDITKLHTALANNTQATISPQEYRSAALAIGRQLHGQLSEELKNKVSVEEFAAYLAPPIDPDNPPPRPSALPDWQEGEDVDNSVQETVGGWRMWLNSTMPLILKKQYGMDYDLSQDGFTVTPRKEERTKPNTFFGQEAELVGYHFLNYVATPPSQEIFEQILPQIEFRAKVAEDNPNELSFQFAKKWLNALKQSSPSLSKEDLYQRFAGTSEEAARLRTGFLRFLLLDQQLIRLNKKQISCRVVDLIGTKVVAGATGTKDPYKAALLGFKPLANEPSGEPRNISADLLLRLQGMGKGLDEPVGTFINPIEEFKILLNDPNCKAIINIAASIPGKPTPALVQDLLNTKEGEKRQIIYIDPERKTAFLALKNPHGQISTRPFDKVKDAGLIDPARVLYYFAPADIRGTDFKIPSGYGALIAGPTTTYNLWEQAIWRLRRFGSGQEIKIYVHQALGAKIQAETQAETLTVGSVIANVRDQTISEDTFQNYKALSSMPEAITRKHVKGPLFRPQGTIEMIRSPENKEAFLQSVERERKLHIATRSYFFHDKSIVMSSYYTPSPAIKTTEAILRNFSTEKKLLAVLESKLHSTSLSLNDALLELQNKQEEFERDQEIHQKHLRTTVPGSLDKDESSQSTIEQQQQQQQQQEQQQQQTSSTFAGRKGGYKFNSHAHPFLQMEFNLRFSATDLDDPQLFPNCGFPVRATKQGMPETEPTFLGATDDFKDLLKKGAASLQEPPAVYLFVRQRDQGTKSFLSVDADLTMIEKLCSEEKQSPKPDMSYLKILITPKEKEGYIIEDVTNPEFQGDNETLMQHIVFAKLSIGVTIYGEKELPFLKKWLEELKPQEYNNLLKELDIRRANGLTHLLLSLRADRGTPVSVAVKLQASKTTPTTVVTRKTSPITATTWSGKDLIQDVGGGGDCGPLSVAHQLSLMDPPAKTSGAQLRKNVAGYLNHPDSIHDPILFGYITHSLVEEGGEKMIFTNSQTVSGSQIEKDLNELQTVHLTKDVKDIPIKLRQRILTYRAERLKTNRVWIDKDFFYILGKLEMPIGIIRTHNGRLMIEERFPSDKPLDPAKTIWIYYDGMRRREGYHFQSFNRKDSRFEPWITEQIRQDRDQAITTFCAHVEEQRRLLNETGETRQSDAVAAMRHGVTDLKNSNPTAFEKIIELVKKENTTLQFDADNFETDDSNYLELLEEKYSNIFKLESII